MDISEVAFQHVVEKLRSQMQYISNLRNQASISAAVTGLIGSVFASLIVASDSSGLFSGPSAFGLSFYAIAVFVLFSTSIACSVAVVIHFDDFTFFFDTEQMLAFKDRNDSSILHFYALYVKDGEWFFRDNEKKISKAQTLLFWAMVLGFVQILPWLMLL